MRASSSQTARFRVPPDVRESVVKSMVGRVPGRLLLLAALVVVSSACRVEATVTVEVSEDGSGTVAAAVELDAAAVDALGGFDDRVRVEDLEAAGWDVVGPTTDGWGVGRMSAAKRFDSPGRLAGVLAEGRETVQFWLEEVDLSGRG
mgnify:CR=1 FL=1